MATLSRVQNLLRTFTGWARISASRRHLYTSPCMPCTQVVTSRCCSTGPYAPSTPILKVQPKVSLCDEVVNIEATGLSPGQLVTLKAYVYTENGKYKFESKAHYKADADGKISGLSDPLPFVIDIRGLLTNLVVDRAVTLASHGFAVFAFDYFLPHRLKSQEETIYTDSQAFLDIIDFVKAHPRLDEDRIGMTSSCYGGAMMLHAATRLDLPIKCMVAAGFMEVICVGVGWKNLDGSLLEPLRSPDDYTKKWTDTNGVSWVTLKGKFFEERLAQAKLDNECHFCLEEKLKCPLLLFAHKDDQHIISYDATHHLRDRLERAGKKHLVELEVLPGTGHFLEVPFQPINSISSLYDPTTLGPLGTPKLYLTNYGGQDTKQGIKDQQFAWRRIVNFFRKHLEVKEMYRTDWIAS